MNEQIRLLVELQKLDTSIITHSRTIKDIPARISTMETPLKEAEAALDKVRKRCEALEKKKRDSESAVDENNERVAKLTERTKDIKDNKAYQAHLKEIESLERGTAKLEDGVLVAMEAIEQEARKAKDAEDVLAVEQGKVEELKRKLDAEVEVAKAGLDEMKGKRAGFVSGIDEDFYRTYMDLLGTNRGVAVTKVANEICTGCNMNIMPQLYVEIKKNTNVVHCPQCRRILYHEPDAPEGEEAVVEGTQQG